MTTPPKASRVLTGHVIDFPDETRPREDPKGAIVVDDRGHIAWRGARADLPQWAKGAPIDDHGDRLIAPGFIDPHIHFPQYRMLAAPGKDLLDWLNRFTFPEEARYADAAHAEAAAEHFLDRLLANGTTSALAFATSHRTSAQALFKAAADRNMAIATGKTMMDCNAPETVLDTVESAALDNEALINDWHGKGRARYAVTPRFAVTSSREQLKFAGDLLARNPGMLMQSHLSENYAEIKFVENAFPEAKDYTDVYDRYGLLGPTSLFGHGIHLSQRERARLAEAGAAITHCPTSNTFLGSGLFSLASARADGIATGIATDIGGGTSYSMLQTMGEAYKVAMLTGYKPTASELFHIATSGNARLLHAGGEIGTLEVGKWADITVIDPCATPVLTARNHLSETIEDVLFALAILGDDRAITATYVAGTPMNL